MQGNCSGAPQFDLPPLDPPLAQERRQCLIYVREDFLETPLQDSHLWLSNLYVTMPGVEKNHSTLIGAHGGDVYMTDMTFVADGDKARAVDVKEGRRVYIAGALTTSRRCHASTTVTVTWSTCGWPGLCCMCGGCGATRVSGFV